MKKFNIEQYLSGCISILRIFNEELSKPTYFSRTSKLLFLALCSSLYNYYRFKCFCCFRNYTVDIANSWFRRCLEIMRENALILQKSAYYPHDLVTV
jgi:hypothetical protein